MSPSDTRISSKRKADDYSPSLSDDLVSIVRMRTDDRITAVHHSSSNGDDHPLDTVLQARVSDARSASTSSSVRSDSNVIHFFIKLIDENHLRFLLNSSIRGTLVTHANLNDTVESLYEKIFSITRIPVIEQRLIYKGKQLECEKSLSECAVQNDTTLHLVSRIRSTRFPQAVQAVDDMLSAICKLCKNEQCGRQGIKCLLNAFFAMVSMPSEKRDVKSETEAAADHFEFFLSSGVPAALVMLYMSPYPGNKEIAETMIKCFIDPDPSVLPKSVHAQAAPVVLEFCKLLGNISGNAREESLYMMCRSTLGSLVETIYFACDSKLTEIVKPFIELKEIFPFVGELSSSLSQRLLLDKDVAMHGRTIENDVCDLTSFFIPLRTAIGEQTLLCGPISLLNKKEYRLGGYRGVAECVYRIFIGLLKGMDEYLHRMQRFIASKGSGESENVCLGLPAHLAILKQLDHVSKLYLGGEERFWTVMRLRRDSVCILIINHAKRTEDHRWLLEHKDVTNFECRRHLLMMMFPDGNENYEELHEMLIDRSQLLAESFEYITKADPQALKSGMFMEFKNEEATGPGVLREWFFLVCQAIFDPQNALFVACPKDPRRFFPNPTSKVNPMYLEYFRFAGRVIGLALLHKVQVGIVFDRVFFLQLAGIQVSLEDILDADPGLHKGCKQILEMDSDFINTDVLGLTFTREVEELGSRSVVELCRGGKNRIVNSSNRVDYVNLLIQHQFVTSISEQVVHFAKGFADILIKSELRKFFFQSLELEDLDSILYGSERAMCVEDWKTHTDYHGYTETDPQILWFWKIVGEMSLEQRKVLLFFWTSVKFLPVDGFRGLASRLYIYRTIESHDRLPSSHTCFFQLCFPQYPSPDVMKARLDIITQEHVGYSFGTW